MRHFTSVAAGIEVTFTKPERSFLADVVPMLTEVGTLPEDPAADRLQVPVYLADPDANEEWWRLMGPDLDEARRADRSVFSKVMESRKPVTLDLEEANALMRVINESRLVLGARVGVEVEDDHDTLPEDARNVLDYLGWILEELTVELTRSL